MQPDLVSAPFATRRPDWQLPQLHLDLRLADDAALDRGRQPCAKCGRSRSLYCYDCLLPLTEAPKVALPFNFSIITHGEEPASKNTGVQSAILAPSEVQLHDIEHCPAFDKSRAVVLFPSDDALDVEALQPDSIDRCFIIDSKWQKAKNLIQHSALQGVRRVKLSNTRSSFWRYHTKGVADEGVCTIEAMLFFLNGLVDKGKLSDPKYGGGHAFDNLLWYFVFQHKVVQRAAAEKAERQRIMDAEEGPQPPRRSVQQQKGKRRKVEGGEDEGEGEAERGSGSRKAARGSGGGKAAKGPGSDGGKAARGSDVAGAGGQAAGVAIEAAAGAAPGAAQAGTSTQVSEPPSQDLEQAVPGSVKDGS